MGVETVERGQREAMVSWRVLPFAIAFLLWSVAIQSQSEPVLIVKITSPLGRMGQPGAVRIVGQVRAPSGRSVTAVRFSVDSICSGP